MPEPSVVDSMLDGEPALGTITITPTPDAEVEDVSVVDDMLSGSFSEQVGPFQVGQETEAAADISDVAIASLAEEPEAQIRYYAEQMGIPEKRFGVVNGQIVYMNEEGGLQAVAPGFWRDQAKGVGPSFPAVGGAVGGVAGGLLAGAPTLGAGTVAGVALGGVGGATAGQGARDVLANLIMDQPYDVTRQIREGAIDFAATVAGLMVGKGVSRALATKAGKEIQSLMGQSGASAMKALKTVLNDLNKKYGTDIRLTPAEISNASKLRAQQMGLEGRPEQSQVMEDFYTTRAGETDKLMTQYLDEVSPVRGADEAGEALRGSAETAMRDIKVARSAKGSPAYQKAFRESGPIDITPAFAELESEIAKAGRPTRVALQKVRREMVEPVLDDAGKPVLDAAGEPTIRLIDDLEMIQNKVKEMLDDEIGAMIRGGRSKAANALRRVQETLLKNLDEASPQFQKARVLWGDLSGPVTAREGGALPAIAAVTEKDFEYMGLKFFGKSSPSEIERARKAILATGEGAANWNAALRGFLEQRWEAAGRVFKSKIARPSLAQGAAPSAFWADLVGNPSMQRRMKAAMSKDQWRAFKNIMDVFQATGRATNYNSTTAGQQQAMRMLDATGGPGSVLYRSAVNPLGIMRRADDWMREMLTERNLRFLADVITNNNSVDELLKISTRSGSRDRNLILIAKAFNLFRTSQFTGFSGPDVIPPVMPFPRPPVSP